MRTELLDTWRWITRVELSTTIFEWVEVFYNCTAPQLARDAVVGRL
jgi:hypothetical protein